MVTFVVQGNWSHSCGEDGLGGGEQAQDNVLTGSESAAPLPMKGGEGLKGEIAKRLQPNCQDLMSVWESRMRYLIGRGQGDLMHLSLRALRPPEGRSRWDTLGSTSACDNNVNATL